MKYESFEPSGSFFMLNENTMLGQGDCIAEMQKMESSIIDLTVTSPPYDNLRTYAGTLEWNFEIFQQVANELYRITKDGGVVVWVFGWLVMQRLKVVKQAHHLDRLCISKKSDLICMIR